MKYVFEPEVLQEVVRSHLDLPLEEMMTAITHDLAERYPGLIDTEPEWFFNNAGGAMGQLTMLYSSFSEYLIFFGSPIGGGGHTGRYRFAEDYATVLDGEMWHHGEGDLQRQEYRPGETVHLPRGTARGTAYSRALGSSSMHAAPSPQCCPSGWRTPCSAPSTSPPWPARSGSTPATSGVPPGRGRPPSGRPLEWAARAPSRRSDLVHRRSRIVTLAWPPPSHIVCRPHRPPVRSSSCSNVVISLAPLQPSG